MIEVEKPVETGVLIVGGGIGGLMAAISAADQGAQVLIAEKANTKRSGSGATGNDHFTCYIPEVHGDDLEPIINEAYAGILGKFHDRNLLTKLLRESFGRVQDWNRWGIKMKVDGRWEFTGHAFPGRPRIFLKYEGANQKEVLNKEVQKRDVKIENRLSISEVITKNGEVIGALGISTENREPRIKVIRARNVILATGSASRLYPSITPALLWNTENCPSCAGLGQAGAYRAGAKLVNLDLPYTHAGPKYLARCGKATWIGVLTDLYGKPVGPFVEKPDKELGDITADVWTSVFSDMNRSGRGPVYMNCSQTSKEDLDYMMWGLKNEGNTAMLDYWAKEGIDVSKDMVEFAQYPPLLFGKGVEINEDAESNVKGLYAVGDIMGNIFAGISGAANFGWIAGRKAAERAKEVSGFESTEESPVVKDRRASYSEIMTRKIGSSWQEANLGLQQIMYDYAGTHVRSESLLTAGLKYLRDLKQKANATMRAENSHELMRCLEVLDLIDLGELVFISALERKESRGLHRRSDYTFTNPLLDDKFLTIRLEDGRPVTAWRDRVK